MSNGETLIIGDDGDTLFTIKGDTSGGPLALPDPVTAIPPMSGAAFNDENVEYDILMPGGGIETVQAGKLEGVPDLLLKAKRHLLQLKMMKMFLKKQKRQIKLNEAKKNRTAKGRKKQKMAKASRKKNRHS